MTTTLDDLITQAMQLVEDRETKKNAAAHAEHVSKVKAQAEVLESYIDKTISQEIQTALNLILDHSSVNARAVCIIDGWRFTLEPNHAPNGYIADLIVYLPGYAHGSTQEYYPKTLRATSAAQPDVLLLLYIAEWRQKVADYRARQAEQQERDQQWQEKQAKEQAEKEQNRSAWQAQQERAQALITSYTNHVEQKTAAAQPLPIPLTVYKWTWATMPGIAHGYDEICQPATDSGYSLSDKPDERGYVTFGPTRYVERYRALKLTEFNLPVIEQFVIASWDELKTLIGRELTEDTYAIMPHGWYRGYNPVIDKSGWLQTPVDHGAPVKERIAIADQPLAWLRCAAYGTDYAGDRQACIECTEPGNLYDNGWRCKNHTDRAIAERDEDLPF